MNDCDEYISKVRSEIEAWKSQPPSIVGSVVSTALAPVAWATSWLLPPNVILAGLTGIDWLAKKTLTDAGNYHFDNLRDCDRKAEQVLNFHLGAGAAEGGAAGFLGFVALPADVVALLTLSLRLIRQTGVEYGYSEDTEIERLFCLSVLRSASANTLEEKAAAQLALAQLGRVIATQTWKSIAEKGAANAFGKEAFITAARSTAKQVGINLTKRKALEAIPLIGAAIGATTSAWFLRDIGINAQMAYRERWLLDREPPPARTGAV